MWYVTTVEKEAVHEVLQLAKAKPSKKQSKPVISQLHTTGTARITLELTNSFTIYKVITSRALMPFWAGASSHSGWAQLIGNLFAMLNVRSTWVLGKMCMCNFFGVEELISLSVQILGYRDVVKGFDCQSVSSTFRSSLMLRWCSTCPGQYARRKNRLTKAS